MNGGVVILSAREFLPLLSILKPHELLQPVEVKPIVVTPTTFEPAEQLPSKAQPESKGPLTPKEMLASLRPPSPNFSGGSARDQDLLAALRSLSLTHASAGDQAKDSVPMRHSMKQIFQRAAMMLEWSAAFPRRAAASPGSELSQAQQMKAAATAAMMASSADSAPQDKQASQAHRQSEAAAKASSAALSSGAAQTNAAQSAKPSATPGHAAAMAQASEQIAQATIRDRSMGAEIHIPNSASMAVPAEMELPVILNAGMLPVWMGVTQLKGPMTPGMFLQLSDEQIAKYLLSLGVKETLLQKFKKIFQKAKKSNKMMVSFFAIFTALNVFADRIIEELSAFMNEEDEVMDRLAHADAHGLDDERRRVYLG